jgi:wobble nucleotide-excising tRNase
LGDETKPATIRGLQALIARLDQLPDELEAARNHRKGLVRQLHANLKEVVAEYQNLYAPVRQFLQSPDRQELSLDLDFKVRIVESGFRERFLDNINRNVRGTFAGIDESAALVTQCLEETDFEDVEAVLSFVDKLDDMLHVDRRAASAGAAVSVPSQLRRGYTVSGLYDVLFGLDYLAPQYSLTFNAQEISQLSPGERGLLLLVFYLLVDKDNIPLVIDQPEENLDNQTIFQILVKCIKAAKQRRQIVMVTHNPNLAVVCDAEQVISADCDKIAKQFSYHGGAIEDGDTNFSVVEVLEGTEPAFVNRKTKYGL